MPAPRWRLLGIAAAGTAAFALPAALGAAPSPSVARLQAEQHALAAQKRSAVLGLYSLDARLRAAHDRLGVLRRAETSLRAQRVVLARELRLARADERLSQHELADRVRSLYDHGSTSALEVIFGAGSLSDAISELDSLKRLTAVDREILAQVRSARRQEQRAAARLAAREARLRAAIGGATAEARALVAVRRERSAYLERLTAREGAGARRTASLEAQARAAEAKAEQLAHRAPPATVGVPLVRRTTQSSGRTVTVVSTGYCLAGRTATGIPAGWGVAAVDPNVIPLGTHLLIPGYGEAVAADTGGSIVGGRIDLWFPTCAQAGGWGSRSVTLALS